MHFEVEEMAYSPPEILSRYPGYQVSKVLDKGQCLHFVSLVLNHFLLTQLSLKKSCCVVMHFYRSVPQIRPPSRITPLTPGEDHPAVEVLFIYLSLSAVYR